MVNKRVKTKFVIESNNRATNPSSGCLVDHTITGKDLWEFYIISVEGKPNQGVPTPTQYSVLLNEIEGLLPEEIQKLTYKLCFTYYNYSGGVKVPAPVKYADK